MKNPAKTLSLGLLSFLVAGCASIPMGGSVNHYAIQAPSLEATSPSTDAAQGPQPGASQEEIVEGFLAAGRGEADNFRVARQYLTSSMADSWRPDDRTLVYSSDPQVLVQEDGSVAVIISTAAEINKAGIATSYPAGTEETLGFQLVQVDGEWRIQSAPQGLLLDRDEMSSTFSSYTLYFYDPSFTYLVPDVRWLANRGATATSLVRLTLEGPAPYLQGAVSEAVPFGLSLTRNSVPVENGLAVIDISAEGGRELSQLDVDRVDAQMRAVLKRVTGIEGIELRAEDRRLIPEDVPNYIEPIADPELPQTVVGIREGELVVRENLDSGAESEVVQVPSGVSFPALSYSHDSMAVLSVDRRQLGLVHDGELSWVYAGQGLTRPSFDQFSWLWTADQRGQVKVVRSDSGSADPEVLSVEAGWLEGVEVTDLSISRDGTRAVIAGQSAQGSFVWVAGVIRGEKDYVPERLGKPVRVASGAAKMADWIGDDRVLVGNSENGQVSIVSLSGERDELARLEGLVALKAGLGEHEILAVDSTGVTYRWSGRDWVPLDGELASLNYSG